MFDAYSWPLEDVQNKCKESLPHDLLNTVNLKGTAIRTSAAAAYLLLHL